MSLSHLQEAQLHWLCMGMLHACLCGAAPCSTSRGHMHVHMPGARGGCRGGGGGMRTPGDTGTQVPRPTDSSVLLPILLLLHLLHLTFSRVPGNSKHLTFSAQPLWQPYQGFSPSVLLSIKWAQKCQHWMRGICTGPGGIAGPRSCLSSCP